MLFVRHVHILFQEAQLLTLVTGAGTLILGVFKHFSIIYDCH